jgi:hypothetical protein
MTPDPRDFDVSLRHAILGALVVLGIVTGAALGLALLGYGGFRAVRWLWRAGKPRADWNVDTHPWGPF